MSEELQWKENKVLEQQDQVIAEEQKLNHAKLKFVLQHEKVSQMQAFWNDKHPDDEVDLGGIELQADEVWALIADYYSDTWFKNRIFVDEREAMTIRAWVMSRLLSGKSSMRSLFIRWRLATISLREQKMKTLQKAVQDGPP